MNEDIKNNFLRDLNQYAGIVHRVCNSYFNDPDERQDVFQEIIYQLWKSYQSFKGDSKFSTWMYKVALNTAMLHIRSKKRIVQNESLSDILVEIAEENNSTKDDMRILYAAINTLNDLDKAIILLYLEEYSYEEIAVMVGISKTNVSVRLVRIKKKLEEKIKQ
jgi:RNA polymerase sigma factor (sigma-70 family)